MAEIDPNTDGNTDNNNNSIAMNGGNDDNDDNDVRIGTISSARFNILSTMVGGGCLSLPLAFHRSGNALVGPLLLLATGVVTEFCFGLLVDSAVRGGKQTNTFESISSDAFGPKARLVSMNLVVLMCFFGTVGYSVLLRDMMEPLNDLLTTKLFGDGGSEYALSSSSSSSSVWFRENFTMFAVVVLVTPFCTLRRLTALKDCGATSMLSLLILGSCIVIRSVQCNCRLGPYSDHDNNNDGNDNDDDKWYDHLRFFPDSWHDVLNVLPLFISCFVCHYNILPVHNELRDPSPARVSRWLRSTTWFAVGLYMVMGFAGSAYAHCTPTGTIQGSKYCIVSYRIVLYCTVLYCTVLYRIAPPCCVVCDPVCGCLRIFISPVGSFAK